MSGGDDLTAVNTMRDIRLGMIGCGLISHAHGRAALKSRRGIRFAACASRDPERAAGWADTYGCDRYYTDYSDMLSTEALDGVVIATWPADHREHIEAALGAGIRFVLCEKALTTSRNDAVAIYAAATECGATVMEGFMYRHHPAMQELVHRVRRGDIGILDSIRGVFNMYRPGAGGTDATNWRRRPDAGGGVAYDFTCYPVDAINRIAGAMPLRVTALASMDDVGLARRLHGLIEYANGVIGIVETSHEAVFSQALTINGSEGQLCMPVAWSVPGDATIVHRRPTGFLEVDETTTRIAQPAAHDGRLVDFPVFSRQLENFAGVIRGEEEAAIRLEESVLNAVVIESLLEAARRQCAVPCRIPASVVAALGQRSTD